MKSGSWTMLLVRVGPAAVAEIGAGATGELWAQLTARRPTIVANAPNGFMTSSSELGDALRVATEVNLWRGRGYRRLSERWNYGIDPRKGLDRFLRAVG